MIFTVCSPFTLESYQDTEGQGGFCFIPGGETVSSLTECINLCLDTDNCQAVDMTATTCVLHSCLEKVAKKTHATFVERTCQRGNLLTHCFLVDFSTVLCWTSPFVILGVSGLFCHVCSILMKDPVSKQCGPDQTPHDVASYLGLTVYL